MNSSILSLQFYFRYYSSCQRDDNYLYCYWWDLINYFKHSNFNLLFRNKTLKPNIIDKMHMYLQITFNCVIKCFVFKNSGLKLNIKHKISAEISNTCISYLKKYQIIIFWLKTLKLNVKHEISAEIINKYLIFKCNIDILASKYLTKYIVI